MPTRPGSATRPAGGSKDCASQRNLSPQGRAQARAFGARLRAEGIRVGRLLSSPWCRCSDTARLLDAGTVRVEPTFGNAFLQSDRRDALHDGALAIASGWRGPGALLIVTHGENIRALTGRNLAPAEAVVVAVTAHGRLRERAWLRVATPPR